MITEEEARVAWLSKKKFCCMLVSNPHAKQRLAFFQELSKYKQVDSGGTVLNNVGSPVTNKMEFIKDYRFVIAFENEAYPGYSTEKIVEPMLTHSIPLYWGNPEIEKDFNPGSFLMLSPGKTVNELIKEIIHIDNDETRAIEMLCAPKFYGNILPKALDKQQLLVFFHKIIEELPLRMPVAKSWKKYLYLLKRKRNHLQTRAKQVFHKVGESLTAVIVIL
jgi:hypothetical protein